MNTPGHSEALIHEFVSHGMRHTRTFDIVQVRQSNSTRCEAVVGGIPGGILCQPLLLFGPFARRSPSFPFVPFALRAFIHAKSLCLSVSPDPPSGRPSRGVRLP